MQIGLILLDAKDFELLLYHAGTSEKVSLIIG